MQRNWLAHLQLLDSALPIGGFAHSFGLETLVQQGWVHSADSLAEYVSSMLIGTWATCDVVPVRATYLYAPLNDWGQMRLLEQALHVQRLPDESRQAVQAMGRRLRTLVASIYPDMGWPPGAGGDSEPLSHAAVYGWVTYQLRIEEARSLEGYLYGCALGAINVGVRLLVIGQTQGQAMLARLQPAIERAAGEVASLDPWQISSAVPLAEIAMMQHEQLYSRLYMS